MNKINRGGIMPKAIWNNVVIADSQDCIEIESNCYFPPSSVKTEYLTKSDYHTTCPWKGLASYYNIEVDGNINENAAWYYPEPKPAAAEIKNYIAFWKDVKIEK